MTSPGPHVCPTGKISLVSGLKASNTFVYKEFKICLQIANAQSTPPIPEKLSPPLRDLMLRCLEPVKDQRPSAKELLIHPLFTQYMSSKRQ